MCKYEVFLIYFTAIKKIFMSSRLLFILFCLPRVSVTAGRLSLGAERGGCSLVVGRGLIAVASVVVEHRL